MSKTGVKFCNNYFLVDPNKASILDLFLLLVSSNLTNRKFIDSPPETLASTRSFPRRWVIFLSVAIRKILISLRKLLALVGDLLTFWLNLLSFNGGFFKLILRLLMGRLVWPDKSSATYTSVIGCTDRRVNLDTKMVPGTDEHNSMLSIMAAKIAYESQAFISSVVQNTWKMDYLGFYNFYNDYQKLKLTQAFMFQVSSTDPKLIFISFRGTEPFNADDWCTDFDVSWYEMKNVGKIHKGFMEALGLQQNGWPKEIVQTENQYAYYTIRAKLRQMLKKDKTSKFVITGHSLGGALAALFPTVLAFHEEDELLERLEGVYTFGQPRVGDEQFGEYMKDVLKKHNIKYERFVYCNDVVPRVPFDDNALSFKHFGPCLYFNSLYIGKVREEEPDKNYFSIIWLIPMLLNAVWELIRSFIIHFWKGKEYEENWFMRLCRLVGLVLPGLIDHFPLDYVNSTCLGGLPLELLEEDKVTLLV